MKILTSITHFNTGEGTRVTYTFSEIEENGKIVSQNNKASFIAFDEELMTHINAIKDYINANHLGV